MDLEKHKNTKKFEKKDNKCCVVNNQKIYSSREKQPHIHAHTDFFKISFLAFWDLKTCLSAKKLKIKISLITMTPL